MYISTHIFCWCLNRPFTFKTTFMSLPCSNFQWEGGPKCWTKSLAPFLGYQFEHLSSPTRRAFHAMKIRMSGIKHLRCIQLQWVSHLSPPRILQTAGRGYPPFRGEKQPESPYTYIYNIYVNLWYVYVYIYISKSIHIYIYVYINTYTCIWESLPKASNSFAQSLGVLSLRAAGVSLSSSSWPHDM